MNDGVVKQKIVEEIENILSDATTIILIDYRGLTIEQDGQLRTVVRNMQCLYKIYKNSFLQQAVEGSRFEAIIPHLDEPKAILIGYEHSAAPEKILYDFFKKHPTCQMQIQCAISAGIYYDKDTILEKVKDEVSHNLLLKELTGCLYTPIASLESVLSQILVKKMH